MTALWKPHNITNIPSGPYVFTATECGEEGFFILLSLEADPTKQFRISFEYNPAVFKRTPLRFSRTRIRGLEAQHGSDCYKNYSFFVIEKSPYIQWVYQESFETLPPDWFTHYVFITTNEIIDVLATEAPSIKPIEPAKH